MYVHTPFSRAIRQDLKVVLSSLYIYTFDILFSVYSKGGPEGRKSMHVLTLRSSLTRAGGWGPGMESGGDEQAGGLWSQGGRGGVGGRSEVVVGLHSPRGHYGAVLGAMGRGGIVALGFSRRSRPRKRPASTKAGNARGERMKMGRPVSTLKVSQESADRPGRMSSTVMRVTLMVVEKRAPG